MNSGLRQYLSYEYINHEKPQYAVFINGKWGCGKTYFIKKWIDDIAKKKGKSNNRPIAPIYISLYGLRKTKDITVSINRALYPILYGKLAKVGKTAFKFASSIIFKQDIDFNGDGKSDTTINIDLDSLSLFKSNENSIKPSKFIVFDDIERCQIDMKELLGYINYFTEQCDCHVLIVGDESQIGKEEKYIFDKFKEKTVGREFILNAEIDTAIDSFVHEISTSDFLNNHKDIIKKTFKHTKCANLRILKQCLYDFSIQENLVKHDDCKWYEQVMTNILCSFIATYCEYKGENKDSVLKWKELCCNRALLSYKDKKHIEAKEEFNQIESKYKNISIKTLWGIFSSDIVFSIINYIETGSPLTNYINSLLNSSNKKPIWEELENSEILSNEDFDRIYDEAVYKLINGQIHDYKGLGTTLFYISYYDALKVKCVGKETKGLIANAIKGLMLNTKTVEESYDIYIQCINRINIRYTKYELPLLDYFCKILKTEYEKVSQKHKNSMSLLLENLTDSNCAELFEMQGKSIPDHSKTYASAPIFNQVDIEKLFNSLNNMGNYGRQVFNSFIRERYMLNFDNSVDLNRDKNEDSLPLQMLNEKIFEERGKRISMERLSFERIYNSINEVIESCKDND